MEKLKDPLYLGLRQNRVKAVEEKEFISEFMAATRKRWPGIVVQFEDVRPAISPLQFPWAEADVLSSFRPSLPLSFSSSTGMIIPPSMTISRAQRLCA